MFKTDSRRTASLVMAFIAIVGLARPALADDWRPFKGHVDERRTDDALSVADNGLNGCKVTAIGAGQATPLGRVTRLSCAIVDANDGSVHGTPEVTAANGDTLCAEVQGGPPMGGTVVGTYTFTGGSGRFIDASGVADFVAVLTFDAAGNLRIAVDFGGVIQS